MIIHATISQFVGTPISWMTMRIPSAVQALLVLCVKSVLSQNVQPSVTTLESHPAKRSSGIISLPQGSDWCRGNATIWIAGHQNTVVDTPNCFDGSGWTQPRIANMDIIDDLNKVDGPRTVLDRHDCGALDINGGKGELGFDSLL